MHIIVKTFTTKSVFGNYTYNSMLYTWYLVHTGYSMYWIHGVDWILTLCGINQVLIRYVQSVYPVG